MAGTLIVLEGTDGSGKSTQFARLKERLSAQGAQFRCLKFPQYEEESSALIRMYLAGEFGSRPSDVNGYAASAFYAVDRYASYKKVWGEWYERGGLVLADRYTTSNAIHQASKVPQEEREDFFRWLYDFEYRKLGLPRPDLVVYLDVPPRPASICSDPGRRRPTPMQTSTSRTPPICAPAGRAAGRPPRYWAGIRCSVFGMISCAPSRISMRRSGARWSRCWTERESNYGLRSVGGWI